MLSFLQSLPVPLQTVGLLLASNVFMTFRSEERRVGKDCR